MRIQALGLSEKLRARSSPSPLLESPFFRLARTTEALEQCVRNERDSTVALEQWREALGAVRGEMKVIVQKLEETGVNLDVVYSLDVMTSGAEPNGSHCRRVDHTTRTRQRTRQSVTWWDWSSMIG